MMPSCWCQTHNFRRPSLTTSFYKNHIPLSHYMRLTLDRTQKKFCFVVFAFLVFVFCFPCFRFCFPCLVHSLEVNGRHDNPGVVLEALTGSVGISPRVPAYTNGLGCAMDVKVARACATLWGLEALEDLDPWLLLQRVQVCAGH